MNRRLAVSLICLSSLWIGCAGEPEEESGPTPNIVLIMTDDQGWAQLGMRGDPVLKTPRLDAFAAESVEFTRFYVSPVCAPTRASLMTGRYNYRTGVVDTWLGRAMMAPDETTIAEALQENGGFKTGIFGKWHLGDNYPMRAMDQGFQEAIVHRGGGIGQPSDPEGSDYFDPILFHNGEQEKYEGYCTDVYFNEAMRFIDEAGDQPFFAYIPTNAPHSPYLVPDEYREPYAAAGLEDKDARIYGMITNIDDNFGRLLDHLDAKGLAENTIVIFMTDNGPTTELFTAGLRGRKTQVYEGGIRAPFFMRWPAQIAPAKIDTIAAHIDVAPTLLAAAEVKKPGRMRFDGKNLMPLIRGEAENWPDRRIFIQSHRGNEPDEYRNMAVITQQLKLIQPIAFNAPAPDEPEFALYDLTLDPGETNDISGDGMNFRLADRLKDDYDIWFRVVHDDRGFAPQSIYLGAEEENPVVLTRQDWRVAGDNGWGDGSFGYWVMDVRKPGLYKVSATFEPKPGSGRAEFKLGRALAIADLPPDAESVEFEPMEFDAGAGSLEVRVIRDAEMEGPWHVVVERIGDAPEAADGEE